MKLVEAVGISKSKRITTSQMHLRTVNATEGGAKNLVEGPKHFRQSADQGQKPCAVSLGNSDYADLTCWRKRNKQSAMSLSMTSIMPENCFGISLDSCESAWNIKNV
jgi:hypothetical protein